MLSRVSVRCESVYFYILLVHTTAYLMYNHCIWVLEWFNICCEKCLEKPLKYRNGDL